MPFRVWPLIGSHAAGMAPKPCTYGQLIALGGLLETGRRVVKGAREGGNSHMRRGGVRGNEGTTVYISLHIWTKFSQNRKEKVCQSEQALGVEVSASTVPLKNWEPGRMASQSDGWQRWSDYFWNNLWLWTFPVRFTTGKWMFRLRVWHLGV